MIGAGQRAQLRERNAGMDPARQANMNALPPRLQAEVSAGRLNLGQAQGRNAKFQAGTLPGQKATTGGIASKPNLGRNYGGPDTAAARKPGATSRSEAASNTGVTTGGGPNVLAERKRRRPPPNGTIKKVSTTVQGRAYK